MHIEAWLLSPSALEANATLAEVNARLCAGGLSISAEDARALAARRAKTLAEAERVEFGQPPIVEIAEAVATSPSLSRDNVARDLAQLQDAFYAARAELPVDVPDEEIVEALRGCLDAWGDACGGAHAFLCGVRARLRSPSRAAAHTSSSTTRGVCTPSTLPNGNSTSRQTAGTKSGGQMTGITSTHGANADRARNNFALLMAHVADLYCMGGCSSVCAYEAHELTASVTYALGIAKATPEEAARVLDVDDPIALCRESVRALERRTDDTLALWHEVVTTMPPIRNVSLRDTLASLGQIKTRYDARFAAHEVPCNIDYQLSSPVDPSLAGLDYVEAWLAQLLAEARWMARFNVASCIAVLEHVCPDYRGLHVNLYNLLLPHEGDLQSNHARAPSLDMLLQHNPS